VIAESSITAARIAALEPSGVVGGAWAPPPPMIALGGAAGGGPSVVLDFGAEVFGGLRLDISRVIGADSCRIRVGLGESVTEAIVGPSVDREEAVRAGSKLDLGVTGFRFARVEVVDPAPGVEMACPWAYGLALDAPRLGSFSCDDARLDRIWEVGCRTIHLCMQDLIWDGIKRGRKVWAGDLHPASRAIAATFGPAPIVAASLDHIRDRTATAPGAPDWMNEIPAYSLWWIICQAEWYLYTGDRAYLEAQHAYLASLLEVVFEGLAPDGGERFDGWRYLDWATTRDFDAIHAGYQGLAARALRSARSILDALGDRALHDRCGAALARVSSYPSPATASKQALALLVLGGLAEPEAINRDALSRDPAAGLTPFLGHAVLEARALAGDYIGALGLIREYWGAMIDLGASTFWEDFDIDWAAGSGRIDEFVPAGLRDIHAGLGRNAHRGLSLSLCHAWSAGPTAWLSRHVLGVRPLAPGCRVVQVRPELGDLSRAEGTFPTPLGSIVVRHRRRPDGSVATEVEAPDPIEVIVGG